MCHLPAGGLLASGQGVAVFKKEAHASDIVLEPTGVLYIKHTAASTSSGVWIGGIAGIILCSTAAGAALLALALFARRRRRQQAPAALAQAGKRVQDGRGLRLMVPGVASPNSCKGAGLAAAKGTGSNRSRPGSASATLSADVEAGVNVVTKAPGSENSSPCSPVLGLAPSDDLPSTELDTLDTPSDPVLFTAASLPDNLQQWIIDPSAFTYLRCFDGQPIELGSGAW